MTFTRMFTKHGLRAHLVDLDNQHTITRWRTICGHDAYHLHERSRFMRRRLKEAAMCFECVEEWYPTGREVHP